jgi:dihydrofolate synthase/folylpolyglutamate synthase
VWRADALGDPLEYLFGLEHFGIKLDLDNIRAIVAALGHPEQTFRSVHVAGTNGKGSVTAIVAAALGAAGFRTARYTSPHLVDLTERFVIDGQPVTEHALRDTVAHLRDTIAALQTRGTLTVHPTFFEVTTAAAFELFRRAAVDIAVCEVGLGGRLDATNVLSPMVCAITSIGRDHGQYLGSTVTAIAAEKAGIIKPGVPVVVGRMEADVESVIARIAEERRAPVIHAADVIITDPLANDAGGQTFGLRTRRRDYGRVTLALGGDHQRANASVAVRVLETLEAGGVEVPPAAVLAGLSRVRWPGRLELIRLNDGRALLMDAAHNPDGAIALARHLSSLDGRHPLVFAAMRDKDIAGILHALLPAVSHLIVTRASLPRSAEPADVAEMARRMRDDLAVTIAATPEEALAAAWRLDPFVVAAGSIFLLGDLMKALGRA